MDGSQYTMIIEQSKQAADQINSILKILKTKSSMDQIDGLSQKELLTLSNQMKKITQSKRFEEALNTRKKWFAPWHHLLDLVHETREGAEIDLEIISQMIKTDEDHTIDLLGLLLKSNPDLGKYFRLERKYVKGTDVGDLIDALIDDFRKKEESGAGKI